MSNNVRCILVGAGRMANFYCEVLAAMSVDTVVIGRGETHCNEIRERFDFPVYSGGVKEVFDKLGYIPTHAIVATGVENLVNITTYLVTVGVKEILLEKPGALNLSGLIELQRIVKNYDAHIWIAYNRRYYSSVMKAEELIAEDGGITSISYEFTELASSVANATSAPVVKNNWFLANSTHVVDLAFYLGGAPIEISSYTRGRMDWYDRAAVFAGAGVTDKNALFSYIANWNAPGRWGIEAATKNYRLIFRPMEKLSIQRLNSFAIEEIEINDEYDTKYKPGLYRQVDDFINNRESKRRLSLKEHIDHTRIYEKIECHDKDCD